MEVDEPTITLYWTDSEKGRAGILRKIVLDYTDVMFGYLTPSSASEVELVIQGYIDSAWDDIWNNFANYVPYVGATQNVDLGTYGITTDYVEFSLTPVASPGAGQIAYDGVSGALSYAFDSSSVITNIGQMIHANVHNAEGSPLTKGQVVYLFSASGNKASVKLARNLSDSTSAKTFGVVAESIGTNQNGYVLCQGRMDGLDTSMFSDGDTLYLGATYGSFTNVKPYAPNHLVYVAIVEKSSNGNGIIYVRCQNGYELDEIHDVQITSTPADGQVLTYEASTSLWKPKTPTTSSGITSLNSQTGATQTFATGSSGTDFNISSATNTHTFNLPTASATNRGLLSTSDWTTFNNKQATLVSGSNIKTVDGATLLGSGNAITGTHQKIIAALGSTIKATTFPFDHGAWSFITNTVALVNQQLLLLPIYLQQTLTLTGVKIHCPNTGNYTGNNYNGVGLYTYSGGTLTLVASTTNDANFWKPTANIVTAKPFSSPYSASAGMYYLGALYCQSAQTTAPTLLNVSMGSTTTASLDFTNSTKIFGTVSALTSLPATQLMTGVTARGNGNMMFIY